ncbi:MAG: RNA 3'-terminal phosphate cyclase [Sandaracinaceae bacterium]
MGSLRDILNRARWRDGQLDGFELEIVHRGAPGDRRVVAGASIASIDRSGVELAPETEGAEAPFIPYHRVVAVRDAAGVVVFGEGAARAPTPVATAASPEPDIAREVDASIAVAEERGGMLVIDGSAGEGGGQILRTSLALSLLTGRPFAIENIRAGRRKPGLLRQHLTGVRAATAIAKARVDGAALGSTRLVFEPGEIVGGEVVLDIGSAGSVSLVIQTVLLPLLRAGRPSRVVVRGGTHASWAPIFPFLEEAWRPVLAAMGARFSLTLRSVGFYPAGGGEVVLETEPSTLTPMVTLAPPSGAVELEARAIVANLSEGIARRELSVVADRLRAERVSVASGTVRSPGPGNALWILARDSRTGLANVFSEIGERAVSAETVANRAVDALDAWRTSGATVEPYLSDQLLLPMAIAGGGAFTTSELTMHARTNREVIAAFTGSRFRIFEETESRLRFVLEGAPPGA